MRVSAIDDPANERADRHFGLAVELDGRRATVRPHGEIDIATIPAIEQCAASLWAEGAEELRLDLGAVTFFDSSGLRLLFRLDAHAGERDGCSLLLAGRSPAVERVLALTRTAARFSAAPSER